MNLPPELDGICATFPHRLVFATVSGAHLCGFPSPDSDYDLRGCHVLPVQAVVGLDAPDETEERLGLESGLDQDLVMLVSLLDGCRMACRSGAPQPAYRCP